VTPDELLAAARELISRTDAATDGVWPRTAALLARQALEGSIDQVWARRPDTAGLAERSMRTQFICLPAYITPGLAARAAYVWAALSSACHHHPYELAPTAAELTRWLDEVQRLTPSHLV
jgi:hypothetical protein